MPKLFVGPMSKNVVDTVIHFKEKTGVDVGFIPSRRQIDYDGGYVNNWTTKTFAEYVNGRAIIQRDHGGPAQGTLEDCGLKSFEKDTEYFDIIHIDPWKKYPSYKEGLTHTVSTIKEINKRNPQVEFEIGTEESIRPFSVEEFKALLEDTRNSLNKEVFSKIKYAVVQSGVGLNLGTQKNTGSFSRRKLINMVEICRMFDVLSKEHNGDYLSRNNIDERFSCGLDSINIAPEFGQIETLCHLEKIKDKEEWYKICYESGKWRKWVKKDFIPEENKETLIKICGHYTFSDPKFLGIKEDIDKMVANRILTRLRDLLL